MPSTLDLTPYAFDLTPDLEAHEPPEARGLGRDGVRLMVSYVADDRILHDRFRDLPAYLAAGDVLVINTSRTVNAAMRGMRSDRTLLVVHFSAQFPSGEWLIELRQPDREGTRPFREAQTGDILALPRSSRVTLLAPFRGSADLDYPQLAATPPGVNLSGAGTRLWIASVRTPLPVREYLNRYGFPISYKHIQGDWPLAYYQTVYANEPGSAEMPSAGRAFTFPLLNRLKDKGIRVLPMVLHAGVASTEGNEMPPVEYYRVPPDTAAGINQAHQAGKRVIAVGTTVIRALETVVGHDREVQAGEGWTDLFITPQRGVTTVDGLLTGFHEARSTHLLMLEALAGREHIQQTYAEALRQRYLWHEFGDLHLILR